MYRQKIIDLTKSSKKILLTGEKIMNLTSKKIINLTRKKSSIVLKELGVIDLSEKDRLRIFDLCKFESIPKKAELKDRAEQMVSIALSQCDHDDYFLIEGPSFFLPALSQALKEVKFIPLISVTRRVTMEDCWGEWTPDRDSNFYKFDFVEL